MTQRDIWVMFPGDDRKDTEPNMWATVEPDGTLKYHPDEDAASDYQCAWRSKHGLDPHTGEPASLSERVIALEARVAEFERARKAVFDSFGHRDSDNRCQCVYCTGDVDALVELAANYEMDLFAATDRRT